MRYCEVCDTCSPWAFYKTNLLSLVKLYGLGLYLYLVYQGYAALIRAAWSYLVG